MYESVSCTAYAGLAFFAISSFLVSAVYATRASNIQFLKKGPRAKKKPRRYRVIFGKVPPENRGPCPMNPPKEREDPYFWLRDDTRSKEEVLQHIRRENAYTELKTAHLQQLQHLLYDEFITTLKESDEEVPYRHGPYMYYTRTKKGLSYCIHCRQRADTPNAMEEIVVDENEMAHGHEYCDVGNVEPSPSHKRVSISVDYSGYETYMLVFKDICTGEMLPDVLEGTSGDFMWGADDSCIYYSTTDTEQRPCKLWLHVMGEPQSMDMCLYEELDQKMWMSLYKTDSEIYLVMQVGGKETSESHILDLQGVSGAAAHRAASFACVHQREERLRYTVIHHGVYLLILTNADGAVNHKIMQTPTNAPAKANWRDIVPHSHSRTLRFVKSFKNSDVHLPAVTADIVIANHIVIFGMEGGLSQVWICNAGDTAEYDPGYTLLLNPIEFPEPVYATRGVANRVFDTPVLRIKYGSLVTPLQTIDYNMVTRESTVLKQQEVPTYDATLYASERIHARARDGTQIPLSVVYHKNSPPNCPRPLVLYGYGSYGHSIDPWFDHARLSLLNRGVVYVIAHIRGGSEMGRAWYEEQGKYLTKKNTFTDFTDCAAHLINVGFTRADRLCIVGRSAGGLLMGAAVNSEPGLFKCVVADVPFVDVLNTMSDPSIPLTVTEWEEWGNPNEEKYFQYMLEYSPYDNVKAIDYPNMLVTGGLYDSRVAFWEPLKWVAKLRELKTDNNLLLCKIDISSGHYSASDRYKYLKEMAFEMAFMLEQLGAIHLLDVHPPRPERHS